MTAIAQTVSIGTVQVSAATSLSANRQTVETRDAPVEVGARQAGLTSINVGAEVTYFLTPRVAFGGTASLQRISVDAPENDLLAYSSAGFVGPFVQLRLPLGDRSSFVFSGSVGGVRTTVTNRNTDLGDPIDVTAYGRYWLAGGGLSVHVASNASFDAGVRFQSSTFNSPDNRPGTVSASGLLVNLGFSLYFR